MVQAIINLVSHTFLSGLAVVGAGTIVYKIGKFIEKYESEDEDSYKKAFDHLMVNSVEEFNFTIDSLKTIVKSSTKATFLLSDIVTGNKVIQKDKQGKIIISEKSKLYNKYEDTISELNDKVKEYQKELERVKKAQELSKNKNIKMNIKTKYSDNDDNDNKFNFTTSDDDNDNDENRESSIIEENDENEENDSDEEFVMEENK